MPEGLATSAAVGDLPRHLLGISRDFEPRLLEALRQRGHPGLRPSFGRLLYLVWHEPRPLGEIAAELGISTQAASRTARLIEQAGYVERRPNPDDRRSTIVAITAQGRAVDDERARDAFATCEAAYAAMVGEAPLASFVGALATLRDAFAVRTQPATARATIGVLPLVALEVRTMIVTELSARGYHLKPSHIEVLPLVGRAGTRPVDLARRLAVSRQAARETLLALTAVDYFRRATDAADQRAVVFVPTDAGRRLLEHDSDAALAVEQRVATILGQHRLSRLRDVSSSLHRAVRQESAPDLERLAKQLRQTLGPTGAARLAERLAIPASGRR